MSIREFKLSAVSFSVVYFVAVLFLSVSAEGQDHGIKSVILNEDPWPPYTFGIEGEEATHGIAVDIIRELFRRLNVEVELKLYPWKRCLYMVKKGQNDGHMLLIKTPEREKYMVFSDPFIPDRYLFWYRADRTQPVEWQNFADLKKYNIGLSDAYSYGDEFAKAVTEYDLEVEYAKSDEMNFQKLLKGRFDTFIGMENVARSIFKENPELKDKFKTAKKPLMTFTMYMSLSKDSPAVKLLPEINKRVKEMKNDGTMEKLINKYSHYTDLGEP